MKEAIQDLIARLLALVAAVVSPAAQNMLERWARSLAGDAPRVGGAWVVRFSYPFPGRGRRRAKIDARLRQFGRRVQGVGFLQGDPGDPFQYEGFIRRNALFGTFRRKDAQMLAGTGTFLLKIAADCSRMSGRCAWYQSRIDDVWSSRYDWRRAR